MQTQKNKSTTLLAWQQSKNNDISTTTEFSINQLKSTGLWEYTEKNAHQEAEPDTIKAGTTQYTLYLHVITKSEHINTDAEN